MNYHQKIIGEIEVHSVEGIRDCFLNGVSANDVYNNEPLIYELTSEYLRGPRFKDCVKVFVDHGLSFHDPLLLAVLLDDAAMLAEHLKGNADSVHRRYRLRCAFTPMYDVTLLHICAEYNHLNCAKVLADAGADINAQAGFDENGFGGHTPVFHTVNQHANHSRDVLHFLLEKSADLHLTIPGLIWGKGYEWETFIPSVNAVSYAMMGLLPQMHRQEKDIAETVSLLLKKKYGIEYMPGNIPNRYLVHK